MPKVLEALPGPMSTTIHRGAIKTVSKALSNSCKLVQSVLVFTHKRGVSAMVPDRTSNLDTTMVAEELRVFSVEWTRIDSDVEEEEGRGRDVGRDCSRRAYLRRPGDPAAPLEVAVTFPTHGPRTRYVQTIPEHETDCPDVRGKVEGCWNCRRCY